MTCGCCHCNFCCCGPNYDANPKEPKKPKVEEPEIEITFAYPPVPPAPYDGPVPGPIDDGGDTFAEEPPLFDTPFAPYPPFVHPVYEWSPRTTPFEWPDELIPLPPTIEDYLIPPIIDYEEAFEEFDFPNKTTDPPVDPPPVDPSFDHTTQWTPTYGTIPIPISTTDTYPDRMGPAGKKNPSITSQGPVPYWFSTAQEEFTNTWDGVPINPDGMSPAQLCSALFLGGYAMKGLGQRYNQVQPFTDPVNPTIAEIDNWNIQVILHLRALVGNTTPLEPDARLYLEAQWANDRYFTKKWDTDYPGTEGTSYGPCFSGILDNNLNYNAHCGASFVPNFTHQAPYLTQYPGQAPFTFVGGGTEGIGPVNTDLPWAIKIVQRISNWVCSEGMTGHAGPFFTRTKVGMSFYTARSNPNPMPGTLSSTTTLRVKWLG